MITIKEVDSRIKAAKADIESITKEKKDKWQARAKKVACELEYLQTVRAFLENNPTEEYLQKELDRLNNIMERAENDFPKWFEENKVLLPELDLKKAKSAWHKVLDLTTHKRHLRTVSYILQAA